MKNSTLSVARRKVILILTLRFRFRGLTIWVEMSRGFNLIPLLPF
jgi:hypothetical protein